MARIPHKTVCYYALSVTNCEISKNTIGVSLDVFWKLKTRSTISVLCHQAICATIRGGFIKKLHSRLGGILLGLRLDNL